MLTLKGNSTSCPLVRSSVCFCYHCVSKVIIIFKVLFSWVWNCWSPCSEEDCSVEYLKIGCRMKLHVQRGGWCRQACQSRGILGCGTYWEEELGRQFFVFLPFLSYFENFRQILQWSCMAQLLEHCREEKVNEMFSHTACFCFHSFHSTE